MCVKTEDKNEATFEKTSVQANGYVVFIAVTVIAINCNLPMAAFGIVFGKFLSTLGDETTGTSLANGILNTVLSFTGLAANVLLNKWSYRNVGLLGAIICSIGCFGLIFIKDLVSFIIFYGVFQGFGYGLLLPASLAALNNFFDKKLSFVQSLSQALLITFSMLVPPTATAALNIYGYRVTLLWIGGLSLLNIPSSIALSEMSWFYKTTSKEAETKPKNYANNNNKQNLVKYKSSENLGTVWNNAEKPLLKKHNSLTDVGIKEFKILNLVDRTPSLLSFHGTVLNTNCKEEANKFVWKSIFKSIDFSLLRSPKYLNISLGLSLSYSSDICFISIIPLMLSDFGFKNSDIALAMSIFFGCDLISRILLSVVSAIRSPNSRSLVLWGSLLSAIFRIGFVWHYSFLWHTITLGALGFLRCFIQTPLPLVIAEEYQKQFATAYSLYMVVCGVVTLVFGLLIAAVKALTGSDVMVCHLLTSCYVICVISWMCEMMLGQGKKQKNENEKAANIV